MELFGVIPQVHVTIVNRIWGSFSDTRSGTACCNFGLWWLLTIFWNFRQWFAVDAEGAACLWQCCCLCHQPSLADLLQGDMEKFRPGFNCTLLWRRWLWLLNPSPVASSPGFAGLAPLLPSHPCLVTRRDTSNITLCCRVADAAQKIKLASQTISVRQCS